MAQIDARAPVEGGDERVLRDKLPLQVGALHGLGCGGESPGDAEGGGRRGIHVGDDQVAGAAGVVGELNAGPGVVEGSGDAGAGVVDVVENVRDALGTGEIDGDWGPGECCCRR